jgi:hypothetical protein
MFCRQGQFAPRRRIGSSVNAFDDERVARAIIESGRKKLIFAGLSLEVCAALRP